MKIYNYSPNIRFFDVAFSDPHFKGFIGVYVLKGEKVAIIDPGPTAFVENIFSALQEMLVNPEDVSYILASHIHLDHTGGVGVVLARLPHARVIVHKKGKPHLIDPARLLQASLQVSGELVNSYGEPEPVPADRIIIAEDGMTLDLGVINIEVLVTPGHASHSLSFYDEAGKNLFEGESMGVYVPEIDSVKLSAPPPFNLEDYLSSIDRLISLSPETIYFSHFGRADRAVARLRQLKEKSLLWGRIIADNMSGGWQDIMAKIEKEDSFPDAVKMLPPERQERELSAIRTSIQGYMEYFRRHGTAALNYRG